MRRWLVLVAACGAPAAKPVENVMPVPAYSCATAVAATVKTVKLGAEVARVRQELETSCTRGPWAEAYVRCKSAGTATCSDTRTAGQQASEQFLLSCGQYIASIDALTRCDKFPQASLDAMKQGLDAMRSGWSFESLPPESRADSERAGGAACQQASDAIEQAFRAMGC